MTSPTTDFAAVNQPHAPFGPEELRQTESISMTQKEPNQNQTVIGPPGDAAGQLSIPHQASPSPLATSQPTAASQIVLSPSELFALEGVKAPGHPHLLEPFRCGTTRDKPNSRRCPCP